MKLLRHRKYFWLLMFFVIGSSAPRSEAANNCSMMFLNDRVPPLGGPTDQRSPLQIMTRRFNGGLKGVIEQLPSIQHNSSLLLTGINPQTVEVMPDGKGGNTINHFGYWPSNHRAINPELGTFADLRNLCDRASALGIRVMIDAVPGHFGYQGASSRFFFGDKLYSQLSEIPDGVLRTTNEFQKNDWENLERTRDPHQVLQLWDEVFAKKRLFGLPGFNHSNAAAKEHLIASYKSFIDAGVRGFRIDATLYLQRHFISDFINSLSAYARSKGHDLNFHLELFVQSDFTLKVMGEDILSRVQNKDEIFFLDFPLMSELRRGIDAGAYQLKWLKGFFENRTNMRVDQFQLIPTLVNHDFGYPINAPEREALLYVLYSFLDSRGSLLLAGTENTSAQKSLDAKLSIIDPAGKIAILNSKLGQYLWDYRRGPIDIEQINDRTIFLRRKNGTKSLVLFAALDEPQTFSQGTDPGSQYKMLLKSPATQWSINENKLTLTMGEADFILFEVNHD